MLHFNINNITIIHVQTLTHHTQQHSSPHQSPSPSIPFHQTSHDHPQIHTHTTHAISLPNNYSNTHNYHEHSREEDALPHAYYRLHSNEESLSTCPPSLSDHPPTPPHAPLLSISPHNTDASLLPSPSQHSHSPSQHSPSHSSPSTTHPPSSSPTSSRLDEVTTTNDSLAQSLLYSINNNTFTHFIDDSPLHNRFASALDSFSIAAKYNAGSYVTFTLFPSIPSTLLSS